MGLNRVAELITKAGKKRNERVNVSSDFGSLTKRGLLADLEQPVEIWWRQIADRTGGDTGEETVEDRKITDLPVVRE